MIVEGMNVKSIQITKVIFTRGFIDRIELVVFSVMKDSDGKSFTIPSEIVITKDMMNSVTTRFVSDIHNLSKSINADIEKLLSSLFNTNMFEQDEKLLKEIKGIGE